MCVLHPTISISVKCISNDGLSSMENIVTNLHLPRKELLPELKVKKNKMRWRISEYGVRARLEVPLPLATARQSVDSSDKREVGQFGQANYRTGILDCIELPVR